MKVTYLNLSRNKYGGRLYESQLVNVLQQQEKHEVLEVNLLRFQKNILLNIPWVAYVWLKYKFFYKDILIITGVLSAFRGLGARKNIVIVHHIDYKDSPLVSLLLQKWNFGYLLRNPSKFDIVVVVSEYWQDYLENRGFNKIELIYNSFNVSDFDVRQEEVDAFKKKYHFDDKPIIYLGNGLRKKGADKAYEHLKSLDANFVVTGNRDLELPIEHLKLSYRDYIILLKASKVVVLMSSLNEGWNRTAHEALLCGTPVVGSGKGGMKEVLESAGQTICEDISELKEIVSGIDYRVSQNQIAFLQSLDESYFEKKVLDLEAKF